jgi:hypothetical protein
MDERNTAAYLREARHRSQPEFVRASALLFLQACYNGRPSGDYHYDELTEKTEIAILDNANEFLSDKETRPALVFTRGPMAIGNPTLRGDAHTESLYTATTKSGNLLQGSFSIGAYSRVDLESERLAAEVFNLFKAFARTFCKNLGFQYLRPQQISATGLIEQSGYGKLWMTSVNVVYYLSDVWELQAREMIPLEKVVLNHMFSHERDDSPAIEVGSLLRNDGGI